MALDLIIRGGRPIGVPGTAPGSVQTLAVAEGRIVEIAPEIVGPARREIDAGGLYVWPGVIDAHVHFNEPGRTEWEGLASGSAALAAGGGTCFCDMPLNSMPPVVNVAAFDAKLALAQGRSCTDFAFWGGLVPGAIDQMEPLAERGVIGFKAFMSHSGIDDFAHADDATLLAGLTVAARLGLPVAVHAENDTITAALARQAMAEGRTGIRDFLRSRPAVAELEAIQRAIVLAAETRASLHVVHVSTAAGVVAVAEARQRGVDVTCETCPHYLVFDEQDVERLGAVAKCAPPIRARDEVERLWQQVLAGAVHFVASDHSPSPPALKAGKDFFGVWGGIAGCQSLLPLLLQQAHRERGMPLDAIAALTAGNVAEQYRLAGKGRLEMGYDADLALLDLDAAEPLRPEHLLYRHPISPYLNLPIHGLVRTTLVRGQVAYHEGRTGDSRGRLVRPARNGF